MEKIISTGSIIPLGDGLTGKTVLTNLLIRDKITQDEIQKLHNELKKSLNIEMEFYSNRVTRDEKVLDTSLQYYVFPGQRQRYQDVAPSFDEILDIFKFLPAIQNISVLLLVYDCSRIESLKSLESWLVVALKRGWINTNTSIILVSNKTDLQPANEAFVNEVLSGIYDLVTEYVHDYDKNALTSFNTSCLNYTGIENLREYIITWVRDHGKRLTKKSPLGNRISS